MDLINIDYLQLTLGFVLGLALGFILTKLLWGSNKAKPKLAASADNKLKLENEVLSDKVKQLNAKITTLEKALEIASK
jgi:uncharacterized membrane-anchored protein YhcB (DUF1043 family)